MTTKIRQEFNSVEMTEEFHLELEWCIAAMEAKYNTLKPDCRQAMDTYKALKVLKSTKAPVPKKRQVMHQMCGDYRGKMRKLREKSIAAMAKTKFVTDSQPPSMSRFLRICKSSEVALTKQSSKTITKQPSDATELYDANLKTAPVKTFKYFTESEKDCAAVDTDRPSSATPNNSSPDAAPVVTDRPSSATFDSCQLSESTLVHGSTVYDMDIFKFQKSSNDFKFNFSLSSDLQKNDNMESTKSSCNEDSNVSSTFMLKPSSNDFKFCFSLGRDAMDHGE